MQNIILTPVPLETLLQSMREIIKEELRAEQQRDLQDKLLSPAEACKVFQPAISKVTLSSWSKKGLLQEHRIGGRVYYKYSQLIESLKSLKKYKKPVQLPTDRL